MHHAVYLIWIASILVACNHKQQSGKKPENDTIAVSPQKDTISPEPSNPSVTYTAMKVKGVDSNYKYIIQNITGDSLVTLLQLNRIDKRYLRNTDTIIIPSIFSDNLLDYAPFPLQLPILKEVEKFFIFAYPIQAYGVYEHGKLLKWGASSMGKKSSKTPTGLHFTNWKGRKITSSVNSSWILEYNFNIMNKFGVGWHQYELPGYPASHSCLRLFMDDAQWLYEYADQWILKNNQLIANGNPVIVFGDYPWGESRPWYHLASDPKANDLSEEELNQVIRPELDKMLEEQEKRKKVLESRVIEQAPVTDTTAPVGA